MRPTLLTLHDPAVARAFYQQGIWKDHTLYALVEEHAAKRPDKFALQDCRHRLTWADLKNWVDVVAGNLHEAGLKLCDRVAAWLPNRVESLVLLLACSRNGYVCTLSLHQNHTVDEVMTLLERCEVAAFVGQVNYGSDADRKNVFERLRHLGSVRRVFFVEPANGTVQVSPSGAGHFPAKDDRQIPSSVNRNPDKVTYIAFTSGTTGQPKALMHSDNTLLANGRAMVADWNHTAETIMYCLGPLSHHLSMIGVEQSLVSGCEFIVNDLSKGVKAFDRIIESGATYVMGVPTHAIDILQEMTAKGLERFGAVRVFYLSGAAIPKEVARRFVAIGVKPQNAYGMTENGSHTSTLPNDDLETLVNTVGQTVGRGNSCYELRIWKRDDRNTPAEPGEIGEIGGRGGSLMLGYYSNQDATRNAFNNYGWFMSGDLGRFDENGNLRIAGRLKDLIIRGGHNIYPAEIEGLALRHPDVIKAAAFPVADDRLGEKVCLAIIPVDGKQIDAQKMLAHLHQVGLSRYDMPEYFLSADEFPLTPSGKMLKRELVAMVARGEISPKAVRWQDPGRRASA